MKFSRTVIFLIIAMVAISAGAFFLYQKGYFQKAPTSFDPPYPEVNTNGDTILAVFEGRVSCPVVICEGGRMKVQLTLYQNQETKAPTTYWLGLIGGKGNDRIVTQGTLTVRQGVKGYPQAVVYELDSKTNPDFRYYWKVNDDILFLLDENLSPKVGDNAWGYMLGRYDAPYGPRTYK